VKAPHLDAEIIDIVPTDAFDDVEYELEHFSGGDTDWRMNDPHYEEYEALRFNYSS